MIAVLCSVQPQWCELIANGKKTIEIRKTIPKIPTPFKGYIYCNNTYILAYDGRHRAAAQELDLWIPVLVVGKYENI